ncbi:hypothetical protein Peur_029392 [Populus x canadensis]
MEEEWSEELWFCDSNSVAEAAKVISYHFLVKLVCFAWDPDFLQGFHFPCKSSQVLHPILSSQVFFDSLLLGSMSCIDCKMIHFIFFLYLNADW